MTRTLLLALLLGLTSAASAQSEAALTQTADRFDTDLALLTRVASAAALAHNTEGAFPASTFELLGRSWAGATGLRAVPFSALSVAASGAGVEITYVPLPVDPYVREDLVVTLTLAADADGRYRGDYQIVRQEDAEAGGGRLPYDVAGRYRVERALGTLCVEADRIRAAVAAGPFVPDPSALSTEPLTVVVHPPGERTPVYFERTADSL